MLRRSLSAVLLLPFVALAAQGQIPSIEKTGKAEFFKNQNQSVRALQKSLKVGEVTYSPGDKSHVLALGFTSAEVVYPIYWSSLGTINPGQLSGVQSSFSDLLSQLSREKDKVRERTSAYQRALCRDVIDKCKEITVLTGEGRDRSAAPVVGLNAAMMIYRIVERRTNSKDNTWIDEKEWADEVAPRLEGGVGDHLVNTCVELLESKGPPNDGARYYLLRSVHAALTLPVGKKEVVTKASHDKAIKAALALVTAEKKFGTTVPREEIEGYKVLRREAVKVAAASRSAELADKSAPAFVLALVAAEDKRVVPAPRTDERTEAAAGLFRMVGRGEKGLNADYAAWCAAHAVQAFLVRANANVEKEKLERRRPWRVEAALLQEALVTMKADKTPLVGEVVRLCGEALEGVQAGRQTKANDLAEWLKANPPKATSLTADAATTVTPAEG